VGLAKGHNNVTSTVSQKHRSTEHALLPNRSLDTIASEVHALEGSNVFAIGDLLIEACESCGHGKWLPWVQKEFAWSADTAERYVKVARLGTKFRKLRNLQLGKTTLYTLANEAEDKLPAIVEDLVAVATTQHLKPADAEEIIKVARLRHRFGDFPDATLLGLDKASSLLGEYRDNAIEALKAKRPTTAEAAEKIVGAVHRAHVETLYAPHGKLPEVPSETLDDLEAEPEECRAKVLERLLAGSPPLTIEFVHNACQAQDERWAPDDEHDCDVDDRDGAAGEADIIGKISHRPGPSYNSSSSIIKHGISQVRRAVKRMLGANRDMKHQRLVFKRTRRCLDELEQARSAKAPSNVHTKQRAHAQKQSRDMA
jgi:hypothetical protein